MVVYWDGGFLASFSWPFDRPPSPMTLGLLLTAFGFGLRHGVDWDHIAAIADLSSTAESRRRGFVLSFIYAVGHGLVVIALGVAAIAFGAALPEGADVWMGRVVGITLIALGAWVLIELVRKGRNFRLRSRWILVIGGTFAGLRWVREATARRRVSIEHDHEHVHPVSDGDFETEHLEHHAHDHAHTQDGVEASEAHSLDQPLIDLTAEDGQPVAEQVAQLAVSGATSRTGSRFGSGQGWMAGFSRSNRSKRAHGRTDAHSHAHSHTHSHTHSHEAVLADGANGGTGNGTAAGIGMLHGIGFESPTQIAVFVASTSIVGAWAGLGLLVAWVVGLIIANSVLALLAAYGLLGAERNFYLYATVAVVVGVLSIAFGVIALSGAEVLPELS